MRCAEPHLLKISFGQSLNVYWKYYMKILGSTATMTKKCNIDNQKTIHMADTEPIQIPVRL